VTALLAGQAVGRSTPQEPAAPATTASAQDSSSKANQPGKKKYSHTQDLLIRGTVFDEKALSFPGVELQLRAEGQKKYKWDTYTNSRGEFAVRVPQGTNYEILVRAKGFVDQRRIVDTKGAGNDEAVVFRMQPVAGGKE